jgi:hypothetical protein
METPSFRIEKTNRRTRDIIDFYMFAIVLVVFALLTIYTYQIHDSLFVAFLFVMVFIVIINTRTWIITYRRTLPASFEVFDDRMVWSLKGRQFNVLELGPSIKVDLLLREDQDPPTLENIEGYVMADENRNVIILQEWWGWDIDDIHSFLPILVGLMESHGFQTGRFMKRYLASENLDGNEMDED